MLSGELGRPIKDIVDDLEHIRKSEDVKVIWATCDKCEFVFEGRKKLTKPGKCPECRSERVAGPWFRI
jgi:predicted Zn-ribbon and HTH transcriptional regulator